MSVNTFFLLCSESSEILEEGLDEKEEEIAEKLEKFLPSFCMGEKCLQFLCVSFFFLLFFFACIFFLSFLSPYSTTLHKNCYTRKKLTWERKKKISSNTLACRRLDVSMWQFAVCLCRRRSFDCFFFFLNQKIINLNVWREEVERLREIHTLGLIYTYLTKFFFFISLDLFFSRVIRCQHLSSPHSTFKPPPFQCINIIYSLHLFS